MIVKGLTLVFAFLAYWFYSPPGKATSKDTTDRPVDKTKETYAYDNTVVDRS